VSSPVCECLLGTLGALYWQPSGSLVERLSGKPVELGQLHIGSRVPGSLGGASVSHQDGACPSRVGLQLFHMDLEPGRASWVGWILVMAGAQQGLKGSGLGEGAGMPASCGTGSRLWRRLWRDLGGHGSVAWPRGRYSCVVWPAWLRDGYPIVCGSGAELWPSAARGAESPAEQSSSSADLRGGDLAAGCSYIRSWCGEAFHDLSL
jgi:hypothetical protein